MAQRDKDETKGEIVKPKMTSLAFRFFFFIKKKTLIPAEVIISVEIGRNDPK